MLSDDLRQASISLKKACIRSNEAEVRELREKIACQYKLAGENPKDAPGLKAQAADYEAQLAFWESIVKSEKAYLEELLRYREERKTRLGAWRDGLEQLIVNREKMLLAAVEKSSLLPSTDDIPLDLAAVLAGLFLEKAKRDLRSVEEELAEIEMEIGKQ